jgi:methionine sulfoxide reductase heme-binding subunit
MTNPATHLFWITSRAAGITALVLASLSVGVGLAMAGKLLGRGPDRLRIHETLSLSVMVAIAVHGLALVGDQYLHPSLIDVTVPFTLSYKTLATSIGIISGWAFILLGLSYYVRKHIGIKRWRVLHRFTLLAWLGGLVHTFMTGTDSGQPWFIALVGLTAAPAIVLLALRAAKSRTSAGPAARADAAKRARAAGRARGAGSARPMPRPSASPAPAAAAR